MEQKKASSKKSHVEHHERAAEKIDGFGDKNHCGAHSSSTLLTCMRKGVKEKEHNKNGWMMEKKKKRRNIYTKRWNKKWKNITSPIIISLLYYSIHSYFSVGQLLLSSRIYNNPAENIFYESWIERIFFLFTKNIHITISVTTTAAK